MRSGLQDTVLLLCSDAERSNELLERLSNEGFQVIGPVTSAAMAMALAAQVRPTVAVIARPPTGRRSAAEAARDLMRTWGVGSVVLREAHDRSNPPPAESRWTAPLAMVRRLRRALTATSTA